jgi:hypothetical protein
MIVRAQEFQNALANWRDSVPTFGWFFWAPQLRSINNVVHNFSLWQVGHTDTLCVVGKYSRVHQSAIFSQPWRKWYIECFKWWFLWYSWHSCSAESKTCMLYCIWTESRFFNIFWVLGSCSPFTGATRDVLLHFTIKLLISPITFKNR